MMQLKWMVTGAFAVALVPGVVFAQSKTSTDTSKTTTTTSTGEVSSISANVTPAMLKAQDDPNLIGSPAWWKTHSTADGKPLSAKSQTGTPAKSDSSKKPE
jgi:hypothetical protein